MMPFSRDGTQKSETQQHPLSLAESITASTRSIHAKLNKLIIARLPLALPSRSSDPSTYVSGLLHIAPIYLTFESLWEDILASPSVPGPSNDERINSILELLHLPALARSDRLRSDIRLMTGWTPQAINEQLKLASQQDHLGDFVRHIRRSVEKRPHILIAYAYILYMALFAGGRYIRATLQSVADQDLFWGKMPSPIKPTGLKCQRPSRPSASGSTDEPKLTSSAMAYMDCKDSTHELDNIDAQGTRPANIDGTPLPFSFFHFATSQDGEDLKHEFKSRLSSSEEQLTSRERRDIVQEAICIFEHMLLLVTQLDAVCGTKLDPRDLEAGLASPHAFPDRLRDSIAITKERRAGKSHSGEDDDRSIEGRVTDKPFDKHHLHHRCNEDDDQKCEIRSSDDPLDDDKGFHHDNKPLVTKDQLPDDKTGDHTPLGSTCCPMMSKSVRFDPKPPTPDRFGLRKKKGCFSTDGPASRRESSDSTAGAAYNKAIAAATRRNLLSNLLVCIVAVALVSSFYFIRSMSSDGIVS